MYTNNNIQAQTNPCCLNSKRRITQISCYFLFVSMYQSYASCFDALTLVQSKRTCTHIHTTRLKIIRRLLLNKCPLLPLERVDSTVLPQLVTANAVSSNYTNQLSILFTFFSFHDSIKNRSQFIYYMDQKFTLFKFLLKIVYASLLIQCNHIPETTAFEPNVLNYKTQMILAVAAISGL